MTNTHEKYFEEIPGAKVESTERILKLLGPEEEIGFYDDMDDFLLKTFLLEDD